MGIKSVKMVTYSFVHVMYCLQNAHSAPKRYRFLVSWETLIKVLLKNF